jgi:hypothetical protein
LFKDVSQLEKAAPASSSFDQLVIQFKLVVRKMSNKLPEASDERDAAGLGGDARLGSPRFASD